MNPRYFEIPEELRRLPNWVVWRLEKRRDKSGILRDAKVPYNTAYDRLAKSNVPATWSSFDVAVAALQRGYNGIGFCLTAPYVGVDLDGCYLNGTTEPWAQEIIRELDSALSEARPAVVRT